MCRLRIRYVESHDRGPQAELNLLLTEGPRLCHGLAVFTFFYQTVDHDANRKPMHLNVDRILVDPLNRHRYPLAADVTFTYENPSSERTLVCTTEGT